MSPSSDDHFRTLYVLEPPENVGDLPPGHPDWDPDLHCPKYRVISVQMQKDERDAEKRRNNQFMDDEPICEPQKKALTIIPTLDLIPPNGFWFDSDKDAEAFIKAVARVSDRSVDVVGKTSAGTRLYSFLDKVFMLKGVRKEKQKGALDVSLQERRDRHWRAVIKESPLARDFTPELVSHVTLMLVCAARALSDDKKGLNGSTDLSNKLEKLQIWFEENDKAALDEFDALHPYRDPNHPNHRTFSMSPTLFNADVHDQGNKRISPNPKSVNDRAKPKKKNKRAFRNQGITGYRKRKARTLPPGVSTRGKRPDQNPQPRSQPLPHPQPERRVELSKRPREQRRYHPY